MTPRTFAKAHGRDPAAHGWALTPRLSKRTLNSFLAVGDSITNGVGASDDAHKWVTLTAAAIGLSGSYTNAGISGAMASDGVAFRRTTFGSGTSLKDVCTYMMGTNEADKWGASGVPVFESSVMADVLWLANPQFSLLTATSGALTETGTWVSGVWCAKKAATAGALLACTVRGSVIYVAGLAFYGDSFQIDILVDGVSAGVRTISIGAVQSNLLAYGTWCVRLDGYANTDHVVTIVAVNPGESARQTFVQCISANGCAGRANDVLMIGTIGMRTKEAASGLYADAMRRVAITLAADGHSVGFLNAFGLLPNNYYGDDYDPNNVGHVVLSYAVSAALGY